MKRSILFTALATTLLFASCADKVAKSTDESTEGIVVEQTQDEQPQAEQPDSIELETREEITLEEYKAMKASLTAPKRKARGRRCKKAKAPTRSSR